MKLRTLKGNIRLKTAENLRTPRSSSKKLSLINSRKSVRWSAVNMPCLSRLCLKLREQGSGPDGVDDLCFHTYGEFSPSLYPPWRRIFVGIIGFSYILLYRKTVHLLDITWACYCAVLPYHSWIYKRNSRGTFTTQFQSPSTPSILRIQKQLKGFLRGHDDKILRIFEAPFCWNHKRI